jgi:hypothetical protein
MAWLDEQHRNDEPPSQFGKLLGGMMSEMAIFRQLPVDPAL